MDNGKELRKQYKELDIEAGKYNRSEFDKVYEIIAELVSGRDDIGDKGNLAYPLVTGDIVDKALEISGFADDKNFVNDFKKYREIEQRAREVQLKAIQLSLDLQKQGTPIDTAMQKAGFTKSKKLQNILNNITAEAEGKNPYFPYPKPFEHLQKEDADLDSFFMLDNTTYNCSGLSPYYRELKEYKTFPLIDKIGGIKNLMQCLNGVCSFIKENNDKPIKVRNKITEVLQAFDNWRGVGLIWQILILQGIMKWFEGLNIKESDKGYIEAQSLCNWVGENLADSLLRYYRFHPFGKNDKKLLVPFSDYLGSTDVGIKVNNYLNGNNVDDNNTKTNDLNLEDVALLYYYSEEWITKDNADTIAKKYGCNSGLKLLSYFTKNSARVNRLSKPSTEIKMKNKIKRFEKVLSYLDENKTDKITEELKILNEAYESGDY